MAISWNEIRDRAIKFSREWGEEISEDAEGKTFLDEFFNVFGVPRRRFATFETRVKKIDGKDGYIDLLWRGVLLVEQKSRGQDLDRAHEQAKGYFSGIKDRDLPRYIMVSDFANIRLYDLETGAQNEFKIGELYKNIKLFGFMAGYQTQPLKPEDPANIVAAELMGRLHDKLLATGYNGHPLEVYLVRLLFLLFAEDTSIFEKRQFQDYIEQKTAEDGHDLGHHLTVLFHTLNTKEGERQTTLDEHLALFPFVNGRLFEEHITPASFNSDMRQTLLDLCALDWSRISPAIFGSLFQSVMDPKARRDLGAHYTSEQNILKLIKPLFLDALWREFGKVKSQKKKLVDFHKKLAGLKFFDPACGCGNFLVIAYRELRLLELEVLRVLHSDRFHGFLDVSPHIWMDVDQFYGIEIEEFPAQIAQVALWMTDHQMNMLVSEEFGQYFRRLPLDKSPNIVHGNALRLDWKEIVEPKRLSYILGNPPFGGKKEQRNSQKEEVSRIFQGVKGAGVLDYVSCWYLKAVEYMKANPSLRAAFVSTNSITQGEQTIILWPELFARKAVINFAYRTFQWSNEGRGKAAVHCVIIGFALEDEKSKLIFAYDHPKSDPHVITAENINPYLVDAPSVIISRRTKPLHGNIPEISYGSMPIDGGWLILDEDERKKLLKAEPAAKPYVKKYVGGDEFINSIPRYCLWLVNCPPSTLRQLKLVKERIDANREYRKGSDREQTRKLASTPMLFGEIRQPATKYLLIPKVSSENRDYIPLGFCTPSIIASGTTLIVPKSTLYEFGVLQSTMHMAWVRAVCGRLESRYQYSAQIVYNNFPWPEPTEKQRLAIEGAAQGVLDARERFPDSTLADLYDPLTTPPLLLRAHQKLDHAADAAYGRAKFGGEATRVAFLFQLYGQIVAPLINGARHS
jgi:hypothetical protein